jgi:hypothetical protein
MKKTGFCLKVVIMLTMLKLGVAAQGFSFQGGSPLEGIRLFTEDQKYYVEVRYISVLSTTEPPSNKSKEEKRLTLYKNLRPPEKVWEKTFSNIREVVVSPDARRVVLFASFPNPQCLYKEKLIFLDENGTTLAEYTDEQLGAETTCAETSHGKVQISTIQGSIQFADDGKTVDIGSLVFGRAPRITDDQELCKGFWDCLDKRIWQADDEKPGQVWRFDLVSGRLLAKGCMHCPGNKMPFPVFVRNPVQLLQKYYIKSENERYKLQTDRSNGNVSLVDLERANSLVWETTLPDYTSNVLNAYVSNDGKRVVITLQVLLGGVPEIKEGLLFFGEKGEILKSYKLVELTNIDSSFHIEGKINAGFINSVIENEVLIVTHAMPKDIRSAVYDFATLQGVRIVRYSHIPQKEVLRFSLLTGELLSRDRK